MCILFHQVELVVDLLKIPIVTVPIMTSHGVWRLIGLRAMGHVEEQQPFTPSRELDRMVALHGVVEQHIIMAEKVLSTCVLSTQMMGSGTSFETVRQSQDTVRLLGGMIGIKSRALMSSKARSFIPPNGRDLGSPVMIVEAVRAIWMDLLFP